MLRQLEVTSDIDDIKFGCNGGKIDSFTNISLLLNTFIRGIVTRETRATRQS